MNLLRTSAVNHSLVEATRVIRKHLSELYRCANPKSLVLCPGQLIGLIHVLHALRSRSILITDEEYYAPEHFIGMEVSICKPEETSVVAQRIHPDVVFMSLVSWKGKMLPVKREFQVIRERSRHCPLLICDYAHAGAIGFPALSTPGADIVCGDLHKWVFPDDHMTQIAFVWPSGRSLQDLLSKVFRGYYLAGTMCTPRAARWISPHDLVSAALWLQNSHRSRTTLLKEYKHNLMVAAEIARSLGLEPTAKSCILWLPREAAKQRARVLESLKQRDDAQVWNTEDGWRILCSTSFRQTALLRERTATVHRDSEGEISKETPNSVLTRIPIRNTIGKPRRQ